MQYSRNSPLHRDPRYSASPALASCFRARLARKMRRTSRSQSRTRIHSNCSRPHLHRLPNPRAQGRALLLLSGAGAGPGANCLIVAGKLVSRRRIDHQSTRCRFAVLLPRCNRGRASLPVSAAANFCCRSDRFSRARRLALVHRSTDDRAQSSALSQRPSSDGSANHGFHFAKQAVQLRDVVRGLPLLYDGHDLSQCFTRSQGQPPSTLATEEG